jgi:hypothetical protein
VAAEVDINRHALEVYRHNFEHECFRHSSGHRVFHIGLQALASTQRLVLADGCRLAALLAH